MNIEFTKNNGILNIVPDGRLDTVTAPELDSFLAENGKDIEAIVIDCEKLLYVSSAGLRVLLSTHKKMKGSMKLTNVCELVMEVFEMTGFADILNIE